MSLSLLLLEGKKKSIHPSPPRFVLVRTAGKLQKSTTTPFPLPEKLLQRCCSALTEPPQQAHPLLLLRPISLATPLYRDRARHRDSGRSMAFDAAKNAKRPPAYRRLIRPVSGRHDSSTTDNCGTFCLGRCEKRQASKPIPYFKVRDSLFLPYNSCLCNTSRQFETPESEGLLLSYARACGVLDKPTLYGYCVHTDRVANSKVGTSDAKKKPRELKKSQHVGFKVQSATG